MRYELNIATKANLGGRDMYIHYAKIILVATDEKAAKAQCAVFQKAFPEPKWKLTLTVWQEIGTGIEL